MSDVDDEHYESLELDGSDTSRQAEDSAEDDEVEVDVDDRVDSGGLNIEADVDTDDDDDDEDDDDDDDDPEDATDEEIDFVLAAYREDGQPYVQTLANDLANDLDELIVQLRRLPGDAGALGFVSLVEEVFVIVRVRGQHVQVVLSDGGAAADWPIAHDVADFLGEDIPDEDEDAEPMGDLGMLADLGLSEFELGAIAENLDLSSDQMLIEIADKINLNPQFRKAAEASFSG
jgi:putative tRNA adenosine deaminase-associated protein